MKKIDVVMWSKNAGINFERVLERIDQVLPCELIDRKILVDDCSIDDTRDVAEDYNWQIFCNPSGGISSGANYALSKVTSPFFMSVEQDVLLNKEWWPHISRYMNDRNVAVAQGIRLSSEPTLRKLDEYKYTRLDPGLPKQFGVSIDNNLFRTDIIRALGGFPCDCPTCTDTILMKKLLRETPFKWVIDPTVISTHLRSSILSEAKHSYRLTKLCSMTENCVESKNPTLKVLRIFLTSPLRACIVAYKKHSLKMLYVYPLIRKRGRIEK